MAFLRRLASASLALIASALVQTRGEGQAPAFCCTAEVLARGLRVAEQYKVARITERRFTHEQFWRAVAPFSSSGGLRTEEVGRSILGRPIRAVTFGEGAVRVLLWSQMHGDEATATMALADLFRFFAQAPGDSVRERLHRELTLVFIPMLNPDGAELFQRQNAVGIDVNRDARALATPEGRTLKAVRDKLNPQFGFNLHDQNARTRVGRRGEQSGIALLAPAFDSAKSYNDVRRRARLVAASLAELFAHGIPGRIAKYDDSFNPRAFGDLMQQWGTTTVLIESGALPDDPQKQRLRALNVAALLGVLDAIATGSYQKADPDVYERLPFNAGGAFDVLVTGGQLVLPGKIPLAADLAINYDDAVARTGGRVRDVGDLDEVIAIDTIDARGLFLHPAREALTNAPGGPLLVLGNRALFDLRRGAEPSSPLVRRIER